MAMVMEHQLQVATDMAPMVLLQTVSKLHKYLSLSQSHYDMVSSM